MDEFKPFVGRAAARPLSRSEAAEAFDLLLSGQATPSQIGGFLMALRVRGETPDEIAGAVSAMRSKMTPVVAPADAVDIVGTGGDASGSYNVSTAAALIVAGAGVKVAKHGNRALSSRSGAADVLTALGVKIDLTPERISACIAEAGLGFMFAPAHHGAMKHVGPTRVELGTRTIFNLLGPCSNPAGVKRQLLGVFSAHWLEPLVEVLHSLGSERVMAVHGSDGLDEITTTGPTDVVSLENGRVTRFTIEPEAIGLRRAAPAELKGGDGAYNALALRAVLAGEKTPYRDIAVLNAAAALMVAGRAASLAEGAALAEASIDHGRAEGALDRLVHVSNE
ncbi:anthranilate phosphoribosyltransferase [Labrys wisconsinensis]|uniref:Anthranilate phosphoribosyltransferase n=1 Tax=Labrys wisconsinensis TaxID=425677 RepID=A0ABU0J4V2_9HYPH|nr:anthranilate phosphoribosyltransferase [Labrys wisconsinensis]MDQ0469293.1 anthranilate phosphoribosyltransferase [Labrys wisconsinensis]